MPYWALILQLARKSTLSHCGVPACAPVSSSSTKFQCPLVALHFCIDDISLNFFQISFIVVKYTQNAPSSPLTCTTLCTKHPYSGAATTAVLSRTCSLLSPGRVGLHPALTSPDQPFPKEAFHLLLLCNSVEKGFMLAQSCSSTVCHDGSQARGNLMALCAAVKRAMMHAC